jgi:hypothetical protein
MSTDFSHAITTQQSPLSSHMKTIKVTPSQAKLKAIVLDFDNTIMNRHVYSMYCNTEEKARYFMASTDRRAAMDLLSMGTLVKFNELLSLCERKGIKVAIGSYGNRDCIIHMCNLLFPNSHIPVYTPSLFCHPSTGKKFNHGTDMGDHKLTIVSAFAKDAGIHKSNIMLIDDDSNNVSAHVQYSSGIPMPSCLDSLRYHGAGLTVEHLNAIIDCIDKQ